jgi:hypothetical protein
VNLGTARIVIIVALVAAGVVVLVNGFDEPETAAASPSTSPTATVTIGPSDTTSPSVSESPTTEPSETPSPQQEGVIVAVFNGTTTPLLAAEVMDTLMNDQYLEGQAPDNAPAPGVEQTIVYYRAGGQDEAQNKADATFLAETYFTDAKVEKLGPTFDDLVKPTTSLVVVIGQDYADSVAA